MFAFTILGLPAHPLVVHGAVVGIPVASLGVLGYVARPSMGRQAWWWVLAAVLIGWGFAVLAGSTGETLDNALQEQSRFIEDHTRWADRLGLAMHVLGASALAMLTADRWRRRRSDVPALVKVLRKVAMPIAVVASISCLALVGIVGHLGAKAAWHDSNGASPSMQEER